MALMAITGLFWQGSCCLIKGLAELRYLPSCGAWRCLPGFQYGFASAWRRFLVADEVTGLAPHFLLIGLCAFVFLAAPSLGLAAAGSVAPVSVSLVIGAFIFGIGMQLANGCESGVLFSFGGGSGWMMVALPFFVFGSLLGSFLLPSALEWVSLGQMPIAIAGNAVATTAINLVLIALGGGLFFLLARRRGEAMPRWLIAAARLGFRCNIGAFLAGIASGSLHGWIWFVMAMAGSWFGIRARPSFGLAA